MKLNHESQGDVLVLKPEGRIDSRNANEFQDAVRTVLTPDITGLVLDLGAVDFVSSAGLREFLILARDLRGWRVGFGICSLAPSVRDVFAITGFDQTFDIHDSQEEAVKAMGYSPNH